MPRSRSSSSSDRLRSRRPPWRPVALAAWVTIAPIAARGEQEVPATLPAGVRRSLETVVEMLLEAQDVGYPAGDRLREREIQKHVGDYILFMTGIFIEYTNRLFITSYYFEEGARAYWSVSEIDRARFHPESYLFRELSTRFERYVGALNYLRSLFFRDTGGDPFESLSRQLTRLV